MTQPILLGLDAVDATEAHALFLEFFSGDDVLDADQGRLAARLALALSAADPPVVGSLPEEAARFLRDRLDPDHPGEPLSFHLRRAYFREWLEAGRPELPSHTWLLHEGRFVLDGIRLARPAGGPRRPRRWPMEMYEELAEELQSPAAVPFWALNLPLLDEDRLGEEAGKGIRAGVLGHLVVLAREGGLGEEHARTLEHYIGWAERNPRGLAALLARVEEEVPPEISLRIDDRDRRLCFASLLGTPLWPSDWGTANLLGALRKHAVLRDSLEMLLFGAGFTLLDPLPIEARVEVLSLSPRLLAAPFRRHRGAAPEWLRGRAGLVAVADGIDDTMGAASVRARAYAAIDLPEVLSALDRDLEILGRPGAPTVSFAAVVDATRCRGALEWLRSLAGFQAWCDVLSESRRIQAALWLKPEAFRAVVRERGHLPLHALAVAARRQERSLGLVRRLLAGWDELPRLARDAEGKGDTDTLHLLCLSGNPDAIEDAIRLFPTLQPPPPGLPAGLTGFELRESPELSEAIRVLTDPLEDLPWLPDAFLAGIAPQLGGAFASVFSRWRLDGPPVLSAALADLRTFSPSDPGLVRDVFLHASEPDQYDRPLPPPGAFDEVRALERLIGTADPQVAIAFLVPFVPDELGLVRERGARIARVQEVLRAADRLDLPEIPLDPLVPADLAELAGEIADGFVRDWPTSEEDLSRLLAAQRAHAARLVAQALRKEGVAPPENLAQIAEGGLGRDALQELLAAYPSLDAPARARALDRAGDELPPRLVRASLRALATGSRPWDGGASPPARVLTAMMDGPLRREPAALARALRGVLNELGRGVPSGGPSTWARAMIFALGKLRETLGGRIPNLLHAYAQDTAVPEDVRAAAASQEVLFDADRMRIQLRHSPEQRVRQALASLREAGRRVDGPRAAEVIGRRIPR